MLPGFAISRVTWQPHLCNLTHYIDGSVQDYGNSSALAMELLQSCTEPSICSLTAVTGYAYCIICAYVSLQLKQSYHGGCWWPGAYLAPGHQQLLLWHMLLAHFRSIMKTDIIFNQLLICLVALASGLHFYNKKSSTMEFLSMYPTGQFLSCI